MKPTPFSDLADMGPDAVRELQRNRIWFFVLGILLTVLGMVAISLAMLTTLLDMVLLGWLLIIGGAAEVGHAFAVRNWRGFLPRLLIGAFYMVFGILVLLRPFTAAEALTLLIAVLLMLNGVTRLAFAVQPNITQRGVLVIGGVLSVVLGVMILNRWPASGNWVPGLFVGVELVIQGAWLITLAIALRAIRDEGP